MLSSFGFIKYLFNGKSILVVIVAFLLAVVVSKYLFNGNESEPLVQNIVSKVQNNDALLIKNDNEISEHVQKSETKQKQVIEKIQSEFPKMDDTLKLNMVMHELQQQYCQARSLRDSSDLCTDSGTSLKTSPR